MHITNNEIGNVLNHLCDLLAYCELASKIDGTGELQAVLRENVHDACTWVIDTFTPINRIAKTSCSLMIENGIIQF